MRECEGEEERAETPHSGGFFLFARIVFVKAITDAGQKLGQNVAHVSTTSGSWTETPPVWSVKKGHLASADACRPTADFH